MSNVLSIILGGGKGTRLYPLTKERAKPAVPFGGKYRLVDIPISNSINSGFKQIYVLTQFNTASLHLHIAQTYQFDTFSRGFIEILAAEQTFEHSGWYEGTADAVRKNFPHFRTQSPTHYLILSGDQLYRMDLQEVFRQHVSSGADVTVAATPVPRERVSAFGILSVDASGKITEFTEKPSPERNIDHLKIPEALRDRLPPEARQNEFLASMGIYVFNTESMDKVLDNSFTDFGKEIIPLAIEKLNVHAYVFSDFWEDIGTIKSFYETNINLAAIRPDFNFYEEETPIFTVKRYLPSSKFNGSCTLAQSLTTEGCIITNAAISNSVIGIRSIIETGSRLEGVFCMGADYYETSEQKQLNHSHGIPDIGIGSHCSIRRAIIDKNVRIGENCRIGADEIERKDGDYGRYIVSDGIIVIPKNTVIPPNTVI